MTAVRIVDALTTGRLAEARASAFEYMALTQLEAGLPVPTDASALPPALQDVLESLAAQHKQPGVLLLALHEGAVCGTVAMRPSRLTSATDAVVQRLYVREPCRRRGIARALMAEVHTIAAREGFHRLVLNVMSTREGALALYRQLGYEELTDDVDWPYGGIWLGREINS
jgi:ribosomal protein S18 acetylase RimI-like enzyme